MARLADVCEILDSKRIPITASDRIPGPYPYYGANGIQDYVADYIFDDELILLAEDGGNFGSKDKPIAYRVSGKCWVNNHAHVLKPRVGYDIDYVCYSLMYYDVTNLVNGATRQKLTQADMREMIIPDRTLEEQKYIATLLDKLNGMISLRKRQLAKLDEQVKARFVEMFGMPGTATTRWPIGTLGDCCILNPKKSSDSRLTSGLTVSFVPMPAVSENGNIDVSEIREYDEVKTGFTYFADNDVLFAKITPCMENGKGAVAQNLHNGIGFGSTEFHVLRPIAGRSNPFWLYAITSFKQFRIDAEANMAGSAGQKRVPASYLASYKISLPPIILQEKFASFYKQVEKQMLTVQQSLDKLEVLKKSLMQEYFGRGSEMS